MSTEHSPAAAATGSSKNNNLSDHYSSSDPSDQTFPWMGLVVVAALAVLLGRGLAPALPGIRSGIDQWVARIETGTSTIPAVGAWLTQLTLLCGSWVCMHFLLAVLGNATLQAPVRAITTLMGSLLFAIVALANVAQQQLGEGWLFSAALCAATLALLAGWRAVKDPSTRAAGIVLLLTALSGSVQVLARVQALDASTQARAADFMLARGAATVAFGLNIVVVLFALYWVLHRGNPKQWGLTILALLPAPTLTVLAMTSTAQGARWWQQLAARTLNELRTHPDPFVLVALRDLCETMGFFVGLLVLTRSRTPAALRAAVGLALISRGNIDVPLCALLLGCSALLCLAFGTLNSSKREHNDATRSEPAALQGV